MQLITISGIDGSGKSTQLSLLQKQINQKKLKSVSFHSVSFSLINYLIHKRNKKFAQEIKKQVKENPDQTTIFEQTPKKAVVSGNYLTILARKIILIIDIFRFRQYSKQLKKKGVDYLLSDRYFYDQIINILYLTYKNKIINETKNDRKRKVHVKLSLLLRLANKIIPHPEKSFFIDVSPQIALARDRDIEQGKEYLIIKRALYKKFLPLWNIKIINGNDSIENIQQQINKFL